LDLGVWQVLVRTRLRRLACRPCRRVTVEAVPFARHRARFTRDFEDLIAWLATTMDKTAITRLCRINWRTVGMIIERVVADELDDSRLDDLYDIGADEIAYRKGHHYLTLIADHDTRTIVWTGQGRDSDTLTRFFDELGADRAAQLQAISIDMSAPYLKAIREHDHVHATVCFDPFHIVQLAGKALDKIRRAYWNELRDRAGPDDARRFKHAPLGAVQTPRGPGRHPSRAARGDQTHRRARVARLPAQRSPTGDLRSRPDTRRGDAAAGPVRLLGATIPAGTLRQAGAHDPPTPRRDPRRARAGDQQRPYRRRTTAKYEPSPAAPTDSTPPTPSRR
jgi:hypothetical protein